MHNAARITVNSLAHHAFWGFLIHFLKLLWSQIRHKTINGPGGRNILLTVILDGNKQIKLCLTLLNLPGSQSSFSAWSQSRSCESDGNIAGWWKMEARNLSNKQACSTCFLSMCVHGLKTITSVGDLQIASLLPSEQRKQPGLYAIVEGKKGWNLWCNNCM